MSVESRAIPRWDTVATCPSKAKKREEEEEEEEEKTEQGCQIDFHGIFR
jgi:hypothetical protein